MKVPLPSSVRPVVLAALVALAGCVANATVQQGPSDTLRAYAQAIEQGRVDDAYRLLSDEAKRSMSLDAFRRAVRENPQDASEIAQAVARPSSDPVVTATVTVPNGDELQLVYEGGRWRIDAAAVDLYSQATPRQALLGFLRAYERKRYDVILRYVPDAEREGVAGLGDESAPLAPPPDAGAKSLATGPQAASNPGGGLPNRAAPRDPGAVAPDGGAPEGAEASALDARLSTSALPSGSQLTVEKLRAAWEGPQKKQINDIVQAIRAALPAAQIEETGDAAAMPYGAVGTVSFVREHGLWKLRDF